MDATRAEKARLGLFLILTGAALALFVLFLVGYKLSIKTDEYFTRISESVTGLQTGSPVKQNGVDIGQITTILTDSSDVQKSVVHFQAARGTAMKTDMVATLGSYGITGLKYLEISGGSYNSPNVPPNGEVRSGLSTLGLIGLRADSIASKVDRLLNNIIAITGHENRENLGRLVESSASLAVSMDSLTRDLQGVKPGQRLVQILNEAQSAAKDARAMLKHTDVSGAVEEYKRTAVQIARTAESLDITVRSTQEDVSVILTHLKETVKNMSTFSREIKENPAVLLRGENKEERRK